MKRIFSITPPPALALVVALTFVFVACSEDEPTPPSGTTPTALSATPSAVTVAAGASGQAVIRGGRKPYSIQTGPDTLYATASIASESLLTVNGRSNGTTSVIVRDSDTSRVTVTVTVTGAITLDLFPLTVGNKFTYDGYATAAGSGSVIPDPTNSYQTIWTVGPTVPTPLGGTGTVIIDSTRGPFGPGGFVVTVARNLIIRKETVGSSGDFYFMQTIGPFKRAFGIAVGTNAADTLIFVPIARPSQGIDVQWTAYDSTFIGTGNTTVRLQIFGKIETRETITDSAGNQHDTYRSRTWRKITVGGSVVQDDATTSRIWLRRNVGPVQIRIVEDTENIGHFRSLRSRNF
jgi:hypothetical protein